MMSRPNFDAYSSLPKGRPHPRMRCAVSNWLDRWKLTHFATLATNDPMVSNDGARRLIRDWDAQMNREQLGPKWVKRPDERMFNFYFLEKPGVNPHWHALIMVGGFDDEILTRRQEILTQQTEFIWKGLKSSGSVDIQPVYHQDGVSNYVAKALGHEVSYSCFVTLNEF
jgi:hypothetical protein